MKNQGDSEIIVYIYGLCHLLSCSPRQIDNRVHFLHTALGSFFPCFLKGFQNLAFNFTVNSNVGYANSCLGP